MDPIYRIFSECREAVLSQHTILELLSFRLVNKFFYRLTFDSNVWKMISYRVQPSEWLKLKNIKKIQTCDSPFFNIFFLFIRHAEHANLYHSEEITNEFQIFLTKIHFKDIELFAGHFDQFIAKKKAPSTKNERQSLIENSIPLSLYQTIRSISSREEPQSIILRHFLIKALNERNLQLLQCLLDAKVDLNFREYFLQDPLPPLHRMVIKEDLEIAALLLNNGADPNFECRNHNSALHYAVKAKHNSVELCKLLLAKGGDPLIQNKLGETPLYLAFTASKSNIIKLFNLPTDEVVAIQYNKKNPYKNYKWKTLPFYKNAVKINAKGCLWGTPYYPSKRRHQFSYSYDHLYLQNIFIGENSAPLSKWTLPKVEAVDVSEGIFYTIEAVKEIFTSFPNASLFDFSGCFFNFRWMGISGSFIKYLQGLAAQKTKIVLKDYMLDRDFTTLACFHPHIQRNHAEKILLEYPEGTYLLRYSSMKSSKKNKVYLAISQHINQSVSHFLIRFNSATGEVSDCKFSAGKIEHVNPVKDLQTYLKKQFSDQGYHKKFVESFCPE